MAKTKEYALLDDDGNHEFTIIVKKSDKKTTYALHASNGGEWNEPHKGELILKMTDTGNECKFDRPLSKTMQYDEICAMQVLLTFANTKENYGAVHSIYKKKKK